MTIGELKQQVKDLLHVGASHDAADLVIVDRLVLQALNNARLWAEREHDFALAMVRGTMVISPSVGGSLRDVTTAEGPVVLKSLVTCFLESANGSNHLLPLTRRPMSTYAGMIQRSNMLTTAHRHDVHYPDETAQHQEVQGSLEVLTMGDRVYLEPMPVSTVTPVTITVHGYRWMPKYVGDASTDFFTEYGSDFLMWKALLEVNHKLEVYVQRQEGTLPPPTEYRDAAWESLLKWDGFMHEEGREHTLGS